MPYERVDASDVIANAFAYFFPNSYPFVVEGNKRVTEDRCVFKELLSVVFDEIELNLALFI